MDQILRNLNLLPPSSGQLWPFYIISTLYLRDEARITDPQPLHVVIECLQALFVLNRIKNINFYKIFAQVQNGY